MQFFTPFKPPAWRLEIGGTDKTALLKDRLLSLTLTDNDGWESDSLSIDLDNRENRLPLPKYDEEVKLWLGYEGALAYMGLFKVGDTSISLRPRTLSVGCAAADLTKASLKANKTRGWSDKTLGDIHKAIAGEHGLKPLISDELTTITFPQVDQANESDINLLTRLGRDYDATVKVANGYLLLTVKGDGKTAAGNNLPVITLNEWDVQPGATIRTVKREQYGSIACEYREVSTGEAKTHKSAGGEPILTLKGMAANLEQAQARVSLALKRQGRRVLELNCTTAKGDNRLMAGSVIKLGEGWHPEYDGTEFVITTATHTLSGAYTTALNALIKPA
jgi:hypothetical protein